MGLDDRPPHPGQAPAEFEFPFAEAERAVEKTGDMAEDLRALRTSYANARDGITVFEGLTADRFATDFGAAMDALDDHILALENQRDAIADDIVRAEARREEYLAAKASWDVRYAAWRDWRPTPATAN